MLLTRLTPVLTLEVTVRHMLMMMLVIVYAIEIGLAVVRLGCDASWLRTVGMLMC